MSNNILTETLLMISTINIEQCWTIDKFQQNATFRHWRSRGVFKKYREHLMDSSTSIIWQKDHPPELKHRPIFLLLWQLWTIAEQLTEEFDQNCDFSFQKNLTTKSRVPGLPIRDCAGSCSSSKQTMPELSVIVVTATAIFEGLYLVLGLSPFEPQVNCPYAPTFFFPSRRKRAILGQRDDNGEFSEGQTID